jgi:TonB family protein
MKLKTFIIMGLTSISSLGSCGHAQQPQYLGESPYNLADVDFNTDVVKFYSKVPTDGYFKEENICRGIGNRTMVIYDYYQFYSESSDKMAVFEDFFFPKIEMLSDEQGKLIGVAGTIDFKNEEGANSLFASVKSKYGKPCFTSEDQYENPIYGWMDNSKRIQLRNKEMSDGDYSCELLVSEKKYGEFMADLHSRAWSNFNWFEDTELPSASSDIILTKDDVVNDHRRGCTAIIDGTMPDFTISTYAGSDDFLYDLDKYLTQQAREVSPKVYGRVPVSFLIDTDGKVKDIKIEEETADEKVKDAATNLIKSLPKFKPATKNEQRVSFKVSTTIDF